MTRQVWILLAIRDADTSVLAVYTDGDVGREVLRDLLEHRERLAFKENPTSQESVTRNTYYRLVKADLVDGKGEGEE